MSDERFELPKASPTDLQSVPFVHLGNHSSSFPGDHAELESAASTMQTWRSPNWASGPYVFSPLFILPFAVFLFPTRDSNQKFF